MPTHGDHHQGGQRGLLHRHGSEVLLQVEDYQCVEGSITFRCSYDLFCRHRISHGAKESNNRTGPMVNQLKK